MPSGTIGSDRQKDLGPRKVLRTAQSAGRHQIRERVLNPKLARHHGTVATVQAGAMATSDPASLIGSSGRPTVRAVSHMYPIAEAGRRSPPEYEAWLLVVQSFVVASPKRSSR